MSTTTDPTSTSTTSSPAATSSVVSQLYVPSSVISIGIGFVGFAAAFVIGGFFLRVVVLRRSARARGESPPSLGEVFFASLGGSGAGGSGRLHMYMNPDAPWLGKRDEIDLGPKPEIWDVMIDEKDCRDQEEEEGEGEGVQDVSRWKPLAVQSLFSNPSRRSNPFNQLSTPTPSTPPSGTATPTTVATTTTTNNTTTYPIVVSLLVAMPTLTPSSQPSQSEDEAMFPDMCFGMTQFDAVHGTSTSQGKSARAQGRIRVLGEQNG